MSGIRILDLAETLIEHLSPGKAIKVKYIGKRANEKLYEELLTPEERERAFEINDLYVVPKEKVDSVMYKDSIKLKQKEIKPHRSDCNDLLSKSEISQKLLELELI